MNVDVEDIGDELISIMQSQLPAAIQAIDSRKTTPYNPDPIQEYHFGEVSSTPLMPSVIVASDQTVTMVDEVGWRQQRYNFAIELNYEAEDVEKCRRIITRYGSAIDDTLRANSTQNQYEMSFTNIAQQFSDTWTSKDGGLYQTVRVTFDVLLTTN